MKSWITRQIRDFAPLTIIVVVGILTHKWWQPYLDSTASHSTVDRSETTSETTYKSVHLTLGNPSGATTSVSNPDNYLMVKPQYALSYNNSKGTPNWVSWELNKSYLGRVDRQNDFRPDETLPGELVHVTPSMYSHSGYDKGHVIPSGDRTLSPQDNSETFLMTNMMPQTPDNNRHTWEGLEKYCRKLAKSGKELYIIAGPLGDQGILKGRVKVPTYTWKIVVVLNNKNVPTSKNIYYHLGKYSDLNSLELDLNAALQSRVPDGIQKGKHKIAIDFNLIPYYGEPSPQEAPYIYRSKAKSGTCSFYAYATLYVIKKNQRVTLAIKAVRKQDTLVAIITYLLALIEPLTLKIERLLLDREFFCVPVIRWLQALDIPFEMPAIIRGKYGGTRQLIRGRRSYKTTYTLNSDKYGSVTFLVGIVCTYKKGKRRAHGREFFVYAVHKVKLSLHSIHDDYRLRFGIESSYRMKNQCRIKTTIKNPTIRFLFLALAFLIINIWIYLLWHYLSTLRRSSKKAFSHLFTLKQMLEFLRQTIDRNYGIVHEVRLT